MICPICQHMCLPSDIAPDDQNILKCGDGRTHFFYYDTESNMHLTFYKEGEKYFADAILYFEQHSSLNLGPNIKWAIKLPGEHVVASGHCNLSPQEAAKLSIRYKDLIAFS